MMIFIEISIVLTFLGLAIFDRGEWLYPCFISGWLFLTITWIRWALKAHKQQPNESDEDYAKRLEESSCCMCRSNPCDLAKREHERLMRQMYDQTYSPAYASLAGNIWNQTENNPSYIPPHKR